MEISAKRSSNPPKDAGRAVDAKAHARVVARRNRRIAGTDDAGDVRIVPEDLKAVIESLPEGPDLIAPRTALPKRSARSEPIRNTLLDVAEALFARWGYMGVSVRDVTDLAGMRLANVSYYFGSKQNLYYEVLRRRSEILGARRLAGVRAAMAAHCSPGEFIDMIVAAYVDPVFDLSQCGDDGWRHFFQLIGHVTFSKLWPPEIWVHYNGPAQLMVEGLQRHFPDAPALRIQNATLLMVGPVIFTVAQTGRIETMSEPVFRSSDLDLLIPETKAFICGGLRFLLGAKA